jgi:hypothetical protein
VKIGDDNNYIFASIIGDVAQEILGTYFLKNNPNKY